MLVRIVKMSFDSVYINEFLELFESKKQFIRNYPGCRYLELYRDKNQANIFFTYSYWETENDLESYRHSDLFKDVWAKTKMMFNNKPEAWSVDKLVTLK
ncbi:antibiotic biosynthesis monooxygenase [Flavobacteriaceae bacterium AU392]|nr:antibiotic biosynthesis monooxygenase [Flavobacteriaceae bacterium]RKM85870.1 antibiotic biosynthesis monooxygenase [Flavobacteriaceae bacterium AU392]